VRRDRAQWRAGCVVVQSQPRQGQGVLLAEGRSCDHRGLQALPGIIPTLVNRIAIVGAGYVGLTTAACLADLGNQVCVVDIDQEKIRALRRHRLHFYEPGLQELVERNSRAERLRFTTSYAEAIPDAQFALIAVAPPEGENGEADVSYVQRAACSIAQNLSGPLVVINKSTVPIGTGDVVSEVMKQFNTQFSVDVVANPEFLREGSALRDFM